MAFVYGSDNSETIDAADGVTEGADTIYGYGGNDTIYGLGGTDLIIAGAGADLLSGDAGNDTLKGGGGADTLNGGSGSDTASYADSAAGVIVLLSQDDAWGGDAQNDELNSIENVTGSAHNDTLYGDDGANVLSGLEGADLLKGFGGNDSILGGDGNDELYGMIGADTIHGGDGDDVLDGGSGNDTMVGGLGDDTYTVDSASDVVSEVAGQGINDVLYASTTYALAPGASVERMHTTDVDGTAAIDLAGNEVGQAIWGNAGVNVLSGLGGSDTLVGGGGDDHLIGGAGGDMLSGGDGNDSFVFSPGEADGDAISDFLGNGDAAGDVLVFSGYGPGATFTQVDNYHWQVNYNGGASHDVITFLNGAGGVHPSDLLFV